MHCDRPRPTQGLPGPSGPEPRKSPKRVRKEYPGAGPQKCPKSAPRSLERVRKESESQILDSFRTLSRLRGALFGHFWGPAPGYSFRTLFGLFRGSGPEGSGRPCVGRGRSQKTAEQQGQGACATAKRGFNEHPWISMSVGPRHLRLWVVGHNKACAPCPPRTAPANENDSGGGLANADGCRQCSCPTRHCKMHECKRYMCTYRR